MSDIEEENEAALDKLEELQRDTTRKRALDLAPDAIEHMGKIMKGHKLAGGVRATPGTRLRAAENILAQAHGRPETRDARGAQVEAGLTIVVQQLTTGKSRVVMGSADNIPERMARGEVGTAEAVEILQLGEPSSK